MEKSKKTTILLAFFLGTFGAHRFYLGQYWKGVFYILFSLTWIPTIISIIDAIIFVTMSKEKFDDKYNNFSLNTKTQNCSGCSTPLTFMTTPNFGGGKLNDGGRVCRKCLKKIVKVDASFGMNSKKKYDTNLVRQILSETTGSSIPEFTPSSNKAKNHNFSYPFYSLLKDFSKSLLEIVYKLQNNDAILEHIDDKQIEGEVSEFIAHCVLYDIIQISNILAKDQLSAKSLEATGLVLATNQVLSSDTEDMLERDFETLSLGHEQGLYKNIAKQLIDVVKIENPIQISPEETNNEKITSSKYQDNLSLPRFLKIYDNPLFEEYVTVLYRYATIISKADNVVSEREEDLLKDIYQLTHKPISEKKNEALHISKGDKNETLDDVLKELNSLIGLNEVKAEINTLINFIKIQKVREQSGLKPSSLSYHIIFTGNPGTGKTTVARIVAKIYKHLGILTEGQLVETDRSGLVAEYTGQTAVKVNKTVNSALDGILFIDEAYSLVGESKDDFGKEAVATLIKRMEDDREKLVLILAGYTKEMTYFINTNPGFKSRFNRYINFPDYTPNELFEIFKSNCNKLDYHLTEGAKLKLKSVFEKAYETRDKSFGNGRFARNIFEKTLEQQANRIAKESNLTKEILTTITEIDINE